MKPEEWEPLFAKALDSSLSDDELTTLERLLKDSDQALDDYLDLFSVELLLEEQGEKVLPVLIATRRDSHTGPIAAGIAALLAIGLGWFFFVTQSSNDPSQPLSVTLPEGESRSFTLDSGVSVDVSGPAEYAIAGPNLLSLSNGTLSADVPPEATGFRVLTPNGDVIDHGTRIGVSATPMQTELHVFEGSAEVRLPNENVSTMVEIGEAVRVNHPNNPGYEPIPLNTSSFTWEEATTAESFHLDFESGSPAWQVTRQGSFSDRGDRPVSDFTSGDARFAVVLGAARLPTSPTEPGTFHTPAQFAAQGGEGRVLPLPFHWRDSMESLCLTSPPFTLHGRGGSLTAYLTGGRGKAVTPPATQADLPDEPNGEGFLGLALRRVNDGQYIASVRRPAGNFYDWEQVEMSAYELAKATYGDAVGETYVLDLIDTYRDPNWSWIGLDSVTVPGRLVEGN